MTEIDETKKTLYERKKEEAARLREKARILEYEARKAKRREDNISKYAIGGLADIAGLLHEDRSIILGGLLSVATADNYQKQKWKEEGNNLLLERKERREKERSEQNERNNEANTGDVPD